MIKDCFKISLKNPPSLYHKVIISAYKKGELSFHYIEITLKHSSSFLQNHIINKRLLNLKKSLKHPPLNN